METNKIECLVEVWQPKPVENLVGRIPAKEGENLPASIEEDVGSFSLCPSYSKKQLRRIHCLRMKNSGREMRRLSRKTIPEDECQ